MSKKDKAKEQQQQATAPVGPMEMLKDMEGVTISDEKRLRVRAADRETLSQLVSEVKSALADGYSLTISPVYGDAAALGCVWNDIMVTPFK